MKWKIYKNFKKSQNIFKPNLNYFLYDFNKNNHFN